MSITARAALLAALGTLLPAAASVSADHLGVLGPASTALSSVGAAQAAFIRRGLIKKKGPSGHFRSTMIVGQGDEGDQIETMQVALTPEDGGPTTDEPTYVAALDAENGQGTWHFETDDLSFSGDPSGYSYTVTAVMLDADGVQVGDVYEDSIKAQGKKVEVVDIPTSVSVAQLDDTNFAVEVAPGTDFDGEVAEIDVMFTEWEITEPIPEELLLVAGDDGRFVDGTLTFGDPASAIGQTMFLVFDLRDPEGVSLGSGELQVVVGGL